MNMLDNDIVIRKMHKVLNESITEDYEELNSVMYTAM